MQMRKVISILESAYPAITDVIEPSEHLREIEQFGRRIGVRLDANEYATGIKVWYIKTLQPGRGAGGAVMRELCDYADMVCKPIYLTRDASIGESSDEELAYFYGKFGFETIDQFRMMRKNK